MRIGLVCPYSLSVPGGVQEQVLGLARSLQRLGHDAVVLAPCDDDNHPEFVIPLGKSIPTSTNGSVAPLALDLSSVWRTRNAVKNGNFDVLHLHEPLAPGTTLAALVFSRLPKVGTFHAAGNNTPYRILHPFVYLFAKLVHIRAAVSPDAQELARKYLRGTYTPLFNGIEFDRFASAVPKPTTHPTVLFLGRHEPRKGLDVLLEAFAHLPDDTHLWVAGYGKQTDTLRKKMDAQPCGERVHWLGRVTDEERLSLFAGADVYCAPNLGGESFGVILLEGMAAGTPIVASDLGAFARVARDGIDALLVPAGDAMALAEGLTRVLGDHVLAQRLVASGKARAREFDMEQLATKYLDLYSQAINRRHRL